jgi:hypothetical protein
MPSQYPAPFGAAAMEDASTAVQKVAVGKYLYVWMRGPNHARAAVITAHGNGTLINPRKPMKLQKGDGKTPKLEFFVSHGHSVTDTGLTSFMRRNVVEELTPATCPEYLLTKYTNSDYESNLKFFWRKHNNNNENYHTIEYSRKQEDFDYDIITIRSRNIKSEMGIPFSEILETLHENGYNYDLIKCAFCRGGKPDDGLAIGQGSSPSTHVGGAQT